MIKLVQNSTLAVKKKKFYIKNEEKREKNYKKEKSNLNKLEKLILRKLKKL